MRLAVAGLAVVLGTPAGAASEDLAEALRGGAAVGAVEVVRGLLGRGGGVIDEPDERGRTALMLAAAGGHEEVVEMLLGAGADLDRVDESGQTALHLAVRRGRRDTVRLLLESGADDERRDYEGRTALYRAIQAREEDIIEMLQGVALARGGGLRSGAMQQVRRATPPRIVESAPAPYTEAARAAGVQGRVVLMVLVRRDGSVGASSVKEGLEDSLDASAQRALRDWKFAPAMRDGRSVEMLLEVEVEFELPDEP